MELIFIHGWGFDTRFWDALAPLLSDYKQQRVDLGFFGETVAEKPDTQQILVGHSLGFMHGMQQRQDWAGWIAINSFPRFAGTCVPGFILKEMRRRLENDPTQTLTDFYNLIHTAPHQGAPDAHALLRGLDELRDGDINGILAASKVPGLVLASNDDPIVPVAASERVGDFAKTIHFHDEGGHMLPQTDAAWCAEKMIKFLAQNFPRHPDPVSG